MRVRLYWVYLYINRAADCTAYACQPSLGERRVLETVEGVSEIIVRQVAFYLDARQAGEQWPRCERKIEAVVTPVEIGNAVLF